MDLDAPRDRIAVLVVGAIVLLLARTVALQVGATPLVERGLYLSAVGCLFACVVVLADDAR